MIGPILCLRYNFSGYIQVFCMFTIYTITDYASLSMLISWHLSVCSSFLAICWTSLLKICPWLYPVLFRTLISYSLLTIGKTTTPKWFPGTSLPFSIFCPLSTLPCLISFLLTTSGASPPSDFQGLSHRFVFCFLNFTLCNHFIDFRSVC